MGNDHLVAETKTLRCGYGPRAVNLSADKKNLFVGCKDGSITVVDLPAARLEERYQERRIQGVGQGVGHGVRFLFDVSRIDPRAEGWLLVGDNSGRLDLCHWKEASPGGAKRRVVIDSEPSPNLEDSGPVILIDLWDEDSKILLISWRHRNTELYEASWTPSGLSLRKLPELPELPGVRGIYAQVKSPSGRLLIGETGTLWHVESNEIKPLEHCWQDLDRPGFVSDVTLVPDGSGVEPAAYLATDRGIYSLPRGNGPVVLSKVHLPGLSGLCMAVSYSSRDGWSFLWVSDLVGDVHMFRRQTGDDDRKWQQYGLRFESSQVMLSIATPGNSGGTLTLCQACRNERIVVSWYLPRSVGDLPKGEQSSAAGILMWASMAQFNSWRQEDFAGWCLEARFAHCLEEAGAEPRRLTEFLASPSPERLACEILKKIADAERAQRALILWTDTLLGTVHRRLGDRREQQCLAVIHWLRKLGEALGKGDPTDWRGEIPAVIETCIQHARKWGVFGRTYFNRREILAPLEALNDNGNGDSTLDAIAYNSLIFTRRVNLEDEASNSYPEGRIAWDLRALPLPGGASLIAVSWGRGGIDLFRAESQGKGVESAIPRLIKIGPLGNAGSDEHRRSLILGSRKPTDDGDERRVFLLEAPAQVAGPRSPFNSEVLRLWLLDPDRPPQQDPQSAIPIPQEESIYSLLELADGYILVGLKGKEGRAPLGLVHLDELDSSPELRWLPFVTGQGEQRSEKPCFEFQPAYPELTSIKLNPVWTLACDRTCDREHATGRDFEVVAGCGDGQIWKLTVRICDSGRSWTVPGQNERSGSLRSVGRLGSPVRALAVREKRVFAGGADGTIISYQEISSETNDRRERFATFWSTREDGIIARLHLLESPLGSGADIPLVLALTQKGTAVLFSNRPQVEAIEEKDQEENLHRPQVPGERLGRFDLATTSFASELMTGLEPPLMNGITRLVVASGDGKVLLATLHFPKYTELRQEQYKKIRKSWQNVLQETDDRLARGQLLRRAEAMYAAAPRLSAILVRWILRPDEPFAESWQARQRFHSQETGSQPGRQWIPRHLQPLVDLDAVWGALSRPETKDDGDPKDLQLKLQEKLLAALRRAREVDDVTLFREIIEVTLNRANHLLFKQARKCSPTGDATVDGESGVMDWYLEVLKCFVEMKGAWLGSESGRDTRIRIVIVKNLVDGDTLWSLSEALKSGNNSQRKYIRKIIDKRSEQIHSFLATGDPLLSLEILRATNLSMTRACRRLKPEEELEWGAIEGYYEAIGDYASRAVHSTRSELGEALAHEIYRTYALGMLACPSHTLRLTHRMSEADLPDEFGLRIWSQFDLLSSLLPRSMPKEPKEIFRIGSGLAMQERKSSSKREVLLTIGDNRKWTCDLVKVKKDNRKLIFKGALFDRIVNWLYDLEEQLSNGNPSVDLASAYKLFKKCGLRSARSEKRGKDPFRHSLAFWKEALEGLCQKMDDKLPSERIADNKGDKYIRPDLVLFSSVLASWCEESRKSLERMLANYQIFNPQRELYNAALLAVEDAARGFRKGAALQKNVVVGVLSHGLLEMLDEHLLELWEIAQALDPEQTWDWKMGEDKLRAPIPRPRAAQFARHVLSNAFGAEAIPKNLRGLQAFLHGQVSAPNGDLDLFTLNDLIEEFRQEKEWEINKPLTEKIKFADPRVVHFLRLVLLELANNEIHGEQGSGLRPSVDCFLQPAKLRLKFHYQGENKKYEHLLNVVFAGGLQAPVRSDPYAVRSHGTGLYLANLAAATVGWSLEMEEPERPNGGHGVLHFVLQEVA